MAFHVKICRIDDPPILCAARVSIAIEPRFLQGNDVPVIGVSIIKNIRVGCFGLVGILLPDSELQR